MTGQQATSTHICGSTSTVGKELREFDPILLLAILGSTFWAAYHGAANDTSREQQGLRTVIPKRLLFESWPSQSRLLRLIECLYWVL